MAKVTVTDNKGNVVESDTFVVVILKKEEEMVYSRSFTSLSHLSLAGHLIAAAALSEALSSVLEETVRNEGTELLYEHTELLDERINGNEKEGNDGDSGAP